MRLTVLHAVIVGWLFPLRDRAIKACARTNGEVDQCIAEIREIVEFRDEQTKTIHPFEPGDDRGEPLHMGDTSDA